MIAKCNVKVNGRWYRAGEELPEPEKKQEAPVKAVKSEPEKVVTEPAEEKPAVAETPKTRSAVRRKGTK